MHWTEPNVSQAGAPPNLIPRRAFHQSNFPDRRSAKIKTMPFAQAEGSGLGWLGSGRGGLNACRLKTAKNLNKE